MPAQTLKTSRPSHPLAAKVAARRWSVLAPAVALISRDFIWYVPSGITGAAVALLFGDNRPVGEPREHGNAVFEHHRGRSLDDRNLANSTDSSFDVHGRANYTADFNSTVDYASADVASLSALGQRDVHADFERTRPLLLRSFSALSVAAAVAKIVSGVDDVIWLSPFVTRPLAQQRLRNAATYLCLFFGLTLFSAVLAWFAVTLWSMLPSGLVIRGWTMEEFLEVASGALLLVYALNLVKEGRGTAGLAPPDPRLAPSMDATRVSHAAQTPRWIAAASSASIVSPVAPPAGVASTATVGDSHTSVERTSISEDEESPDPEYYSDGGGEGAGETGDETSTWGQDLEAADDVAEETHEHPAATCSMANLCVVKLCSGARWCSGCCGAECHRSNAVADDPSQWSSPVPEGSSVPASQTEVVAQQAEDDDESADRPLPGERNQQDLTARRLVVVALLGGLDDVCVQTLLLLAGSFDVSHMLVGDLIGCSFLLAISCGSVFADRAMWLVNRVPLYPLVVGVLATYTVVCGIMV